MRFFCRWRAVRPEHETSFIKKCKQLSAWFFRCQNSRTDVKVYVNSLFFFFEKDFFFWDSDKTNTLQMFFFFSLLPPTQQCGVSNQSGLNCLISVPRQSITIQSHVSSQERRLHVALAPSFACFSTSSCSWHRGHAQPLWGSQHPTYVWLQGGGGGHPVTHLRVIHTHE